MRLPASRPSREAPASTADSPAVVAWPDSGSGSAFGPTDGVGAVPVVAGVTRRAGARCPVLDDEPEHEAARIMTVSGTAARTCRFVPNQGRVTGEVSRCAPVS